MRLLLALLLVQGTGGEEPELAGIPKATNQVAFATAMLQADYAACNRPEDAARVEREYLALGAEARARAPDYEEYLRRWQSMTRGDLDGAPPQRGCDDWGRDLAERQFEAALASYRRELDPEAGRPTATFREVSPDEARLQQLRGPMLEADLFARGAVARAMAAQMWCGNESAAAALETRLLEIERSVPEALEEFDFHGPWSERKYESGQSRDGSWPRPPGVECPWQDQPNLDRDAEEYLQELAQAAEAWRAARR